MKTQNFGATAVERPVALVLLDPGLCFGGSNSGLGAPGVGSPVAVARALKNYKENRENGTSQDNPKSPFPSNGFENLDIKSWDTQSSKWPDSDKRYWYKLTLNNGSTNTDFYYKEQNSFNDAKGKTCWSFIIGHRDGTQITGFTQKPNYGKGFPDKNKWYWYDFEFNDERCPAIRQWMEEKDLNYLRRIRQESPGLFRSELAGLKSKNSTHPAINQLALEDKQAKEAEEQRKRQEAERQRAEQAKREAELHRQQEEAERKRREELRLRQEAEKRELERLREEVEREKERQRFEEEKQRLEAEKARLALAKQQPPKPEATLPPTPTLTVKCQVKALYDYAAQNPSQLSLQMHNQLELLSDEGTWWQCRDVSGNVGWVPSNHVARIEKPTDTLPLPPSPMPVTPAVPDEPKSASSSSTKKGKKKHTSIPKTEKKKTSKVSSSEKVKVKQSSRRRTDRPELLKTDVAEGMGLFIDYKTLQFGKRLGAGGFGEVYRGHWSKTEVAIKKLLQRKLTAQLEQEFRAEAGVMIQLRHPNILTLYGIVLEPESCMVLEFMAHGSLYDVLRSDKALSWQMRYQFGLDVARGLTYLHDKKILHRDLKSLNILLNNHNEAKLADFGLAKIKLSSSATYEAGMAGTTQWIAPELFLEDKPRFTPVCDVYSFAMVLWELMSRELPYKDIGNRALIPARVAQGKREQVPPEAPQVMRETTTRCWAQDPKRRPTMEEALTQLESQPVVDDTPIPSPHSKATHHGKTDKHTDKPVPTSSGGSSSSGRADYLGPSESYLAPSNAYQGTNHPPHTPTTSTSHSTTTSAGTSYLGQTQTSASSPTFFKTKPTTQTTTTTTTTSSLPDIDDDDVLEAVATHNYRARAPDQLSFTKGAKLNVLEQQDSGWWLCELNGKQGLAPSNRLNMLEPEFEASGEYKTSSSSTSSGTSTGYF